MSTISLSESQRRLAAATIYCEPLKPWETRALRLEPVRSGHDEGDIIEVHLETAVIPPLEGLGLVGSGEVVLYEALSYTWGSPVLSHAIRCNGFEFSVTANLHAALVHLRGPDAPRWLWIDALCINQYDEPEKERQVRNMFHIYRKASTVLVWLGPAGPGTSLGADIVNVFDMIWQEQRCFEFDDYAVEDILMRRRRYNGDTSINLDELLNDLQEYRLSDDERVSADTLGLVSLALDGIASILGCTWIRRTWIIQELAAAPNAKFQCGRSVLSYDGFFHVIPNLFASLWRTRSTLVAGKDDPTVLKQLWRMRYDFDEFNTDVFPSARFGSSDEWPASCRESLAFAEVLYESRSLVNGRFNSRRTKTELLLMFLVQTMSRGFDVSIAVDRVYSLTAMADAISSASCCLTHGKRMSSSPQQLPVDYSVGLQAAVLRLLKIRMNEVEDFYVTIESLFWSSRSEKTLESEERRIRSTLFSMCSACSPPPSWLKLLEFDPFHGNRYPWKGRTTSRGKFLRTSLWTKQDVTEPDTLVMCGKALGRLIVDSEGHTSRIRVAQPCPLGQEFETYDEDRKPYSPLFQGCSDSWPAEGGGDIWDNTETGSEPEESSEHITPLGPGEPDEPSEQQTALGPIGSFIHVFDDDSSINQVEYWSWELPPDARDGDVIVVFTSTCALLRPSQEGRYTFVERDLIDPRFVRPNYNLENNFIINHQKDLDTFILI